MLCTLTAIMQHSYFSYTRTKLLKSKNATPIIFTLGQNYSNLLIGKTINEKTHKKQLECRTLSAKEIILKLRKRQKKSLLEVILESNRNGKPNLTVHVQFCLFNSIDVMLMLAKTGLY